MEKHHLLLKRQLMLKSYGLAAAGSTNKTPVLSFNQQEG